MTPQRTRNGLTGSCATVRRDHWGSLHLSSAGARIPRSSVLGEAAAVLTVTMLMVAVLDSVSAYSGSAYNDSAYSGSA